ncbi:hypothetical protein K3N28_05890 [Glycomyces sp. TRM65418]|uniref:hypothetical protein n=1 Tax=Glycomyces sp. TRM65418 TaxID=2867006 RepID=UPI001CE68FA3|nr:hypothetical protein [Glycomyces sp. TRM65418]MCC3762600.1 hypothetical protein [Glycomyces sp. TRM65418]QZD56638.1 hypothetical protein K3N28_05850 [Glycomyces sp. TRM65418]
MPSDLSPAGLSSEDERSRQSGADRPTLKATIAGLDLVGTRYSPSLVTITEEATGHWVANVARLPSGTRVVSHNYRYRDQFGVNAFDPNGCDAREALSDHATKLWN